MKHFNIIVAGLLALGATGCTVNQSGQQHNGDETLSDTSTVNVDGENATKVLSTLPSPHEIIDILVGQPDSKFDAGIVNSQSQYLEYNTTASKALNLGVYGVDMSYASLFNQNQTVLQYMAVVKNMAEQLGVLKFFDEATMRQMEQNMDNKEKMIDIISTAFYNSDQYLLDNGQHEIAAMIISGAWIEAMYTAFKLTKGDIGLNKQLSSRILKQCESIDLMVTFLSNYTESRVGGVADDFKQLQSLIQKAGIIQSDGVFSCNDTDFKAIADKVFNIRSSYVAL